MRILGIDPGSRICGYGVVDDVAGEMRYIECGILTAPEAWPMEQRLGEIARGLREVIAELAPVIVAVEDVFIHKNARSGLALAQARGMALAVIGLAGLKVASYPPASVKKAVAGTGRAEKDQIARMVQALIGLRSLPRADATDALAVALTHGLTSRPTSATMRPCDGAPAGSDMISRLIGTLVRDGEHVIVDCNGVGYEVSCSTYTLAGLPTDGERVELKVYTQMRETAIALYGFIDVHERDLFDLLITVKNVGPSTALAILSGANPRDIAALIARGDVPGLTRIKGIGKKTAELLVVEIREKCELLSLSWNAGGIKPAAASSGSVRSAKLGRHPLLADVMSAMVGMGLRPVEAESAIADLQVDETSTIESLLRQALRAMPR